MKVISSEEQHRRMLETPVLSLLISLSIPTVISQLVSTIYNTADTWFVSQIGTSASAAVGVAFSLQSIIQACGFGLGMGSSSLISIKLGEKKDDEARIYASSAFFAALAVGLFIEVLGLVFLEPLMRLLGSTETILPYAKDYVRYILLSAPFMCSSCVMNNVLRSEGEARLGTIGLCAGGILNIILDPVFIFVLDLGIAGAAIATAISQTVGFVILLAIFVMKKSFIEITPKNVSKNIRTYGKIISVGMPTIFRQGLGSLSTALLNISASKYGDAAVAAITIVNKIYMLVRNILIGVGQGFQPIAGYNFGAGNKKRTRKVFIIACIIGTVICSTAALGVSLFPKEIMTWFRDDPEVIAIGAEALKFSCLVMPLAAYSTFVNQLYQCLGFRVRATILASCRQGIFFIPLVFILPAVLKLTGVEMVQPGADLLTFFISIPYQILFFRTQLNENYHRPKNG